ncbi:MAG: transposase [Pirellulales bacterium]
MGVRALQAKIEFDRTTLEHLWRTHRVFNERLPHVLRILFKLRRGEYGTTTEKRNLYQKIGQFITAYSSQNADYLMNSISMRGWKPATAKNYKANVNTRDGASEEISGTAWADEAAMLSASGELVFDKEKLSGDLPGCMRQMLNRDSVAMISGHDELVANWNREHEQWLKAKTEWESKDDHKKYLAIRARFEEFESELLDSTGKQRGRVGKRRGRWHLYLKWLRDNPSLAAWRGGTASVNELSLDAQERIRRAKPWKQRSVEAEEFWKINEELAALDKVHGHYEREFVRRRKTKRNPDGFDHRPTFTEPHPVNHPRWFVFNAPQTNPSGYRDLELPRQVGARGSVQLLVLTGDKNGESEYPTGWIPITFRADPRMCQFRRVEVATTIKRGKEKGQTKTRAAYEFFDRHLQQWRSAEISGIKLMLRDISLEDNDSLVSAAPYLVFTCTIDDLPLTDRARKIEWSETGQMTKSGKARKSRKLPDGLVACAVDLGLRHVGFATLSVYEDGNPRVLRSRNIWLDDKHQGPDLAHIGRHKREIRRLRRLRGKPVKGEESHIELQEHITHMGEDRFKKAARGIINFAWNVDQAFGKRTGEVYPRADVIILEKLEGFIPDAEKERGINRALAAWNRAQLVNRLKEMAIDAGYKGRVFEIHPAGTSQVCCRCGALGRRYSIARGSVDGNADIRFGWVEKLFACPSCGYRANSDHNASVNLHRKFLHGDVAVSAFFRWTQQGDTKKKQQDLAELDAALFEPLRALHGLAGHNLVETPF